MATSRNLATIVIAAILAIMALAVLTSAGQTQKALAGPCADYPLLYRQDEPDQDKFLTVQNYFMNPGEVRSRIYDVDSVPEVPPPGKPSPYLTIDMIPTDPVPGHAGINADFSPSQADEEFSTILTLSVDANVPPGAYEYEIEIVCHPGEPLVFTVDVTVYVGICPAPASAGIAGVPPLPEECELPADTPTATPTSDPTPSDSPTPTDPSGVGVVWGNHNCSGNPLDQPDAVDSLLNLRYDANLSTNTGDCPAMGTQVSLIASNGILWGDVDCDGAAGPIDSLKILRFNAGLSVSQSDPCPVMGSAISLTLG